MLRLIWGTALLGAILTLNPPTWWQWCLKIALLVVAAQIARAGLIAAIREAKG